MRAALAISALLHLSIIAAALVSLPPGESFSTPSVNALPVDLVTVAEETDLSVGEPDAETVVEQAAPETVEAEAPPEPETQPGATQEPAERIATEEDAVDSADVSAAPEPAGEPEAAAGVEEADPADRTEAAAAPTSEPEPAEPAPASERAPTPTPETVVPRSRPAPPRRTRTARVDRQAEDAFDADRLSQLINRTDPTGGGSGAAEGSLGAETGREAAALTLSEKDALRAQMQRCWNPPVGLQDGRELVITVKVRFRPDGTVDEIEEVGAQGIGRLYDVAADAARRAVLGCQPYTLPPQKYDAWKHVQVNFDPRELY